MLKLSETFLKFTNHSGVILYVALSEYVENHPDSYDGEVDPLLYKWENGPNGWAYYTIG